MKVVSYQVGASRDEHLLKQITLGNKAAFGELYTKYWDKAYFQAFKGLADEDKAKDIVQEIFLNIWLRKEFLITNFPAYLRASIRNQVLKQVARERHIDYTAIALPDIPSPYIQADAQIRRTEFYASYNQIVATLPPKRQTIFKLRHHDDLTTKTIAAELGLSVKTVQNQLGKAVEQLSASLWKLIVLCPMLLASMLVN